MNIYCGVKPHSPFIRKIKRFNNVQALRVCQNKTKVLPNTYLYLQKGLDPSYELMLLYLQKGIDPSYELSSNANIKPVS